MARVERSAFTFPEASDHQQDLIQEHSTSARLVEHNGSGRAELIFTFCPILEVSDVEPEGGSTARVGFAQVERNGRQQHVRSF